MSARDDIDVAIIGAGAAGLAAAIFAARNRADLRIVVFDGARTLGAKILVSGGGRCNVTNRVVTAADYNGGSRNTVRNVLSEFSAMQAVTFFRELGVELHEEEHGKLFPNTNRARTVLDALANEAHRLGIAIRLGHRVEAISRVASGFEIVVRVSPRRTHLPANDLHSTAELASRQIVLATGGLSLPKTGSDGGGYALARALGHSIVPTTPALVPLILDGHCHKDLSGISHDVALTIRASDAKPLTLHGSLLWTHFGISGPVVLDISRHWHRAILEHRDTAVAANLINAERFEDAEARWREATVRQPRTQVRTALATLLPARVAEAVLANLALSGQTPLAQFVREDRRRLLRALVDWPLPIRDSRGYTHAEVTAGGVPLSEIDPRTMQSRICPGLFLVGEILDVDGRLGGFNFQWSWSSAFVAGRGGSR